MLIRADGGGSGLAYLKVNHLPPALLWGGERAGSRSQVRRSSYACNPIYETGGFNLNPHWCP